jgi:hypothetical protein
MADLKPLGSEKLQGMDKIQRILEISRFRESAPSSINETSKSEYSLNLADGNEYQIVREKSGYIIKQTISESNTDYIAPIQERKYYSSYSQALKKLNLMAKEMNEQFGNDEGISLFSEQKKFTLKTPNTQKKNLNPTDEVENVPPPAPSPAPAPPSPEMGALPSPPPPPAMGDEGEDTPPPPPPMGDESDMDDEESMGMENGEDHEEQVTFKTIQKLTGKLGQKLRTLNSDEETEMSSKDIKYVINSILSALDLENLSDDDKEDIMNKFEGIEDEEDFGGSSDKEDFGTDSEEEESPEGEEEPLGFGEMGEGTWDDLGKDISTRTAGLAGMKGLMVPGQFGEGEDNDTRHLQKIADSVFMESKVEDVLINYFTITESEEKFNNKIKVDRLRKKKINNSEIGSEIKRLSETIQQEISSKKFLKENSHSTFVGKTNKKNLIFEFENKQYKVTPKGNII